MPFVIENEFSLFQLKPESFEEAAIAVFKYQFKHNLVYQLFAQQFIADVNSVTKLSQIPFLPIEAFKTNSVRSGDFVDEAIFTSSGTTSSNTSKHFVKSLKIYEASFNQGFNYFYGDVENYCILALLPSYLERNGSSLVYMAAHLIKNSKNPASGFYLDDFELLKHTILDQAQKGKQILLIGVSFALLDFAEQFPFEMPKETIIMETGGMKGRRKEIIRAELHHTLKEAFGLAEIHSEYGMTELLSQAYSTEKQLFNCPPWMQILIREADDPLAYAQDGVGGGINIIDLANLHSCSFLATSDLGKLYADGSFEILGRFDASDVRGCNLLVQ